MTISSASSVNFSPLMTGLASGTGRATVPSQKNSVGMDQFMLSPSAEALRHFLNQTEDGKSDSDDTLSGLELLKQNGELLAGVLQSKLKNFEANLTSTLQNVGLNPTQTMTMQQGIDGLLLTNTPPDKEQITKLLGKDGSLAKEFQELSRLAELLGSLQQAGSSTAAATTAATRYAQQSQTTAKPNPDARFVLNVMQGNVSFSFE